MDSFWFDIRNAARGLVRAPAYSSIVVLTLGLTIGAATAVFSIVDGVLLKPLAYRESHRLVSLKEVWRQLADRIPTLDVNERHFEYWRSHARTFESMAQYIVLPANLTGAGDAVQIDVARVSGSLFDVLKTRAAHGRVLTPDDERLDRPDAAVITDALWRQRFGADPGIVGRTFVLDGTPRTIVGVLDPGFRLPTERLASTGDAFVPIHMDAERLGWEGDHNNEAIGRLRAGVTPEQARAELDVLQAQVGEIAAKEAHEPVTLASVVTPLAEALTGGARRGLLLLLGAIASVLLIACSNLANLSLTRAIGRKRDSGIMLALGAGRSRLVAHAAIEQITLSTLGGALGLAVAWLALRVFVRTAPIDLPRVNDVAIDGRALAFAVAVSLLAGVTVAILPAWRASRHSLEQTLRAGALTTTTDRGGARARSTLLALQVALSVALLVVTGLLGVSFARLMGVDRGFQTERVLLVPLSFSQVRYATDPQRVDVYDRVIAAVRHIPGVGAASPISVAPLTGSGQVNGIAPERTTLARSEFPTANFRFVGPEFFKTMGIAVLRGRAFTDADRPHSHAMPALVSDRTAARLWPTQDALGQRFSRGIPGEDGFEVVGIVADAKLTSLERTPPLMVYLPYWWRARPTASLLVRAAGDPESVAGSVRRAIFGIDPEIAIGGARPLDALVDRSMAPRRYQMQLFMAFGAVALFIATLGVYAVTAYGVSQRRREMNIRVALGASAGRVVAMVMRDGVAPIAAGVLAGTGAALAAAGLVAGLLFGVRPHDPIVFGSVVAVVVAAGVSACFVAARRGLVIDPASALREE